VLSGCRQAHMLMTQPRLFECLLLQLSKLSKHIGPI
jgi:hypothetical protein